MHLYVFILRIWISVYMCCFAGIVICNWCVMLSVLITVWCTFDAAGRSWVKMKKYQRSMREAESRFQYKRSGTRHRNWRQRYATCSFLAPGVSVVCETHDCVAFQTLVVGTDSGHVYPNVMLRQELNAIKYIKYFYFRRQCLLLFLPHAHFIRLEIHGCQSVLSANVIPHVLSGTCCRKVIRAYQDSWDQRCRLLFCCMRNSDRNRVSTEWHIHVLACFLNKLCYEYGMAHQCSCMFS